MNNEQLENFEELGRRAVACKHWRWMPGMRVVTEMGDAFRVEDIDFCFGELNWPKPHALLLPDLRDPATLGCMLALVRDAHRDPRMFVETYSFLRNNWRCTGVSFSMEWDATTEAGALVAALDAAP